MPVAAAAIVAVLVSATVLFSLILVQDVTSVGSLTRDPTVTAEEPWYLGAASSLGAIGWATAAAVFGFAALIVRRAEGTGFGPLASAALLSLLLLVDDVFLLHDDILLRVLGSELPVYAAYAVLGGLWLASTVRMLEPATALLLATSVCLLALSVVVDVAWASDADLRLVVEDGAKFAGIWLWALFAVAFSTAATERAWEGRHG